MNSTELQPEPTKSTFVTILAWIFIILSGFGVLISILQNIMIHVMFSDDRMQMAMAASNRSQDVPYLFRFMTAHMPAFFAAFLGLTIATFASSIGLLKRQNWARLAFIGLMAFGIAWQIFGMAMQFYMFSTFSQMTMGAHNADEAQFNAQFHTMTMVVGAYTITASYSGTPSLEASNSVKIKVTVNP